MKNGPNRPAQAGALKAENLATTVPLLDVNRGTQELRGELIAAAIRVIDSGRFLFGRRWCNSSNRSPRFAASSTRSRVPRAATPCS